MPSAARLVRSVVLLAAILCTAPANGSSPSAVTHGSCVNSTAAPTSASCTRSHAAIMDLWLAMSLGLIVLYVRRRLRERR